MKTAVVDGNVRYNWTTYVVVAATLAIMLSPKASHAQVDCKDGADYECTYDMELEGRKIQKVPNAFKFQAKISQARLPVGDVSFSSIFVLLKRGEETVCEEELTNVMVRDSVLNMEIGRGMSNCNLDEIIANSDDIGIDVCIKNKDNCLKRIKLSTVPYAVKSSFANTAQKAHTANEAVQCNYAHRVTADRDLFVTQTIGKGYYDFHTPAQEDLDLLNVALLDDDAQSLKGGYIQWTPVDPTYPNLHISGKNIDSASRKPITLKELILHAEKTKTAGVAIVYGDNTSGTYDLIVHGDVQVMGNQRIENDLEVANNATIFGHATMENGATINNGAVVSGSSTVAGLTVNDMAVINGMASAMDGLYVEDGANIYGITRAQGGLTVAGGSTLSGGATVNGTFVSKNDATIEGILNADRTIISGNMTIGDTPHSKTLTVNHDVYFNGDVTLPGDMQITAEIANELAPGDGCPLEGEKDACDIVNNANNIADNTVLIDGKQNRVTEYCGTDQYIRRIYSNGTVLCGDGRGVSGNMDLNNHRLVDAYAVNSTRFYEPDDDGSELYLGTADAETIIRGSTKFDCPSCGDYENLDGSSNWGDLTIQGRMLSTNSYLYLSPPGGSKVVIKDDFRAAGGETSDDGAGLEVEGHIAANSSLSVAGDTRAQADLRVDGDINARSNLNIRGWTKFDCPSCGDRNALDGSSNYGDLTVQGRVLSSSADIHLSPPGGNNVVINDVYRAAGGESSSDGAGLEVQGDIVASSDLEVGGTITTQSASVDSSIIFPTHGNTPITGWKIDANTSDDRLRFYVVSPLGTAEKVTFSGPGVGIGDSSPDADLDVEGTIYYNALAQESDRRLKKEIADIPNALDIVNKIRGVSYRWKETERFDEDTHFGFIAQELQEVLPEIVGNDGEYLNVSYVEVIPYLVEAIKEQQLIINDLTETCQEIDINADMVAGLMRQVHRQQKTIDDMRDQMSKMQAQIDTLAAKR